MEEGGDEGELVKSEELYERLHCKKFNFVTSNKSKKVRKAEEQTGLEDVNLDLIF